jgi:hypothetical protein
MIDITIENNRNLFENYNDCLIYLNKIDLNNFEYPNNSVNFHVYSEIRNEKELLCVESYLATQNLEKTKLILWSDYDISNNKLIEPYKKFIDLRVYIPEIEMKDTLLEGNKEWINAIDKKHYMRSGILRFLVTNKYGGIWADMDMVFLRDFKPILDQEWAYMWGSEMDFRNFGPCAAMMNINKKSDHSNLCMNQILKTRIVPDSTVLDHQLLAKVYSMKKFYVFPSVFFNTEWQINTSYSNGKKIYDSNGLGTKIATGWFSKNEFSNYLFDGAFSWHWHNSTYKKSVVEEGSKFDILTKKIKKNLIEKRII